MDVKTELGLIQGAPLQLGRKVYVCPALNVKGMRMFREELTLLQKGLPEESISDSNAVAEFFSMLTRVSVAALSRNYPEITEEEVEDGLDFNNIRTVTLAVLGASGFKTRDAQAADAYLKSKEGVTGESTGTV